VVAEVVVAVRVVAAAGVVVVVRAVAVVVRVVAVVVRALAVVPPAALARARVPAVVRVLEQARVRVMAARVGAPAQGRPPVVARRAVLPEPGRWAPALARGRQEAAPMPG
jgi:hypothetical protein